MGTLVQGLHGKQGRVSNIISYAINLVMLALYPECEAVQRVQRNMEWILQGGKDLCQFTGLPCRLH